MSDNLPKGSRPEAEPIKKDVTAQVNISGFKLKSSAIAGTATFMELPIKAPTKDVIITAINIRFCCFILSPAVEIVYSNFNKITAENKKNFAIQ